MRYTCNARISRCGGVAPARNGRCHTGPASRLPGSRPESEPDLPSPTPIVVRNRANYWSGLVIQIMLVGLLLLSDPLRLTTEHDQSLPPEDRLMSPFWVLMIVALAVVSLFALAAYWYPRLEVTESTVTARNPLQTITVGRETVAGVRTAGLRHPVLMTRTREVSLRCIEQSLGMRLRRGPRRIDQQLHDLFPWRDDVPSGSVATTWRRPTPFEIAVCCTWLVLLLVAVLRLP